MSGPWPTLLVRPDDTPGVGSGHVMRTLALVERWVPTGPVRVALSEPHGALADRVRSAGAEVVAAGGDVATAGLDPLLDDRPSWVVLDGYGFGPEVQAAVRAAGPRVAVVDDHGHHGRYEADLVLDQNLGARSPADRPEGSAALIGPRYALVRSEFDATRSPDGPAGEAPTVVVTLGGFAADRAERLADVVAAGLAERGVAARVTTPARAAATAAMGELLGRADLVVSAAGSTAWELCALGRAAVVVAVADNQVPVGLALGEDGAARYLGRLDDAGDESVLDAVADLLGDGAVRARLADRAAGLVDGLGADRVVTELRSDLVRLRPVGDEDRRLLWEWANDPDVRASAWTTAPIRWEDHCRWWDGADPGRRLHYVADHGGERWGQIRFDLDERGVAEVDVSVAASCRGRRAAAPLIRAGVRRLFADRDATAVRASVRGENQRSLAAFLGADFTRWPTAIADGGHQLTYLRGRDGRH